MARISRRELLVGGLGLAGAAALAGIPRRSAENQVPGSLLGTRYQAGHRLRDGGFPPPTEALTQDILIVGGGVAGLSAAWALERNGISDYLLLDLEEDLGGNARCGQNAVSAYPWGAHYVPLLNREARAAQALFEELGVITGWRNGLAVYNPYFLSADPHERLLIAGHWQDGLVPLLNADASDRKECERFLGQLESFGQPPPNGDKRAFAIPTAYCSTNPVYQFTDSMSMRDWMMQGGFNSKPLHWYVDYCCRDDYGAGSAAISAWAGIHYFAARHGHLADHLTESVLTWPEGNGWLVRQMTARMQGRRRTGLMVYRVQRDKDGVTALAFDLTRNISLEIKAKAAILAVPHFIVQRLLDIPLAVPHHYSPWMVANLTLNRLPQGKGSPLAWDNVVYDSKLLGYVVATHQNLNRVQNETVITYYWPLDHLPPAEARREALQRSCADWQAVVLDELYRIHPELHGAVRQMDVWVWGHGMIRPVPGFVWHPDRVPRVAPPLFLAHADQSGISIFEEAQYQGVRAAEELLHHWNHAYETLL